MDGTLFIQDLALVLLAAGLAGALCKRLGLSVIVGFLAAGLLIGPHIPLFSLVTDVERIQTLSQVGLVFLMFSIGLGLSLTKLARLGLPTLAATALGAFGMLHLTQLIGALAGWSPLHSLFVASMVMVSSSAVIAKTVTELKLTHEGSAQRALGISVMEDVVAIVMLTLLASQVQAGATGNDPHLGILLASLSAFVVMLVGIGLFFIPRLLRRLEARADPELQTIIVAGVLFLLSLLAAKAGYSLALGAFLLGAIVAEMPQKAAVEKAFAGLRDLFSSVFFVSIGMMIELPLLAQAWPWILGLFLLVMIARPVCTGVAMVLTGTAPGEARRASLLLTPIGEFSFIIAQLGVAGGVLPRTYYPIAVGTSILTVLATPLINRHADTLITLSQRLEPRWLPRTLEAYQGWLQQLQDRKNAPLAWRLVRGRLLQIGGEILIATGLLIFSGPLLDALKSTVDAGRVKDAVMTSGFWSVVGLLLLIMLVALWRNISAVVMILAEGLAGGTRLPASVLESSLRTLAAVMLGYWLYAILPFAVLPGWGWALVALTAIVVVAVSSSRLIYWHSTWQSSVHDVFNAEPVAPLKARSTARVALDQGLESWNLHLDDCIVPDDAAYAGSDLAHLAIPTRFGCSVIELERNGYVITRTGPDLRVYPGDKLMLLGKSTDLVAARSFIEGQKQPVAEGAAEFGGSVLETHEMPPGPHTGQTLASLSIARLTGVRVVGIQRGETQIINPTGDQRLIAGDSLLVVGTLAELRAFRRWLRSGGEAQAPFDFQPAAPTA
jgi:CPA2 family monovalent cation:H+ antiporter-2